MSKRSPIIYIVDDDASVRRALALLLNAHGFRTRTFSQAMDFLADKHPKVPSCLVLDVRLPDIDGPVLQDTMAAEHLDIPIVFITGHGSVPISVKAMKGGAVDFLPKPFTGTDLLNAVERAIARSKQQNEEQTEISAIKRRLRTLSPRELEVFRFVAQGMLNKQIARKRGTSLQTIKVHRGRVMHKMQARTVTELIRFAQKAGVVLP
jgi:FixJ family two-component response regulator